MKRKHNPRSLIIHRLENISKTLFKKYYDLITQLIGSSPGIYALYDENELYYVGKSTDLKRRVRYHLRDRHGASWTHFSLYLIRKIAHINEIESLLVRIANPKGNRIVPKGRGSSELLRDLKMMVKKRQQEEFEEMFAKTGRQKRISRSPVRRNLKGLVSKRTPLYRTYKGREYKAYLLPSGIIKFRGKKFTTPSAAAKIVVQRRTVDGWRFWYTKDSNGDWVKLSDLRK